MSTEINLEMVDLDQVASAMLAAYIEAKAKSKEWAEKAKNEEDRATAIRARGGRRGE